jgi:peptidylprolyl isomerase
MGTDKRQRQKEGRAARIAAAQDAQRRSDRRRRYLTFIIMALVILGLFALINALTHKSSSKVNTANSSTTSSTAAPSTTAALASAKGKKCVATKGPLPKGAPAVPVQVGPPPADLVIKDLKVGTGAEVKATDTVTVNYIGVACSTGKVFDSSWSRGQTAEFPLNQVIKGWTTGLTGMRVGGRRLLGIPPAQAYGSSPPQGSGIAPDESLWFVVDMVKATPATTTTTAAVTSTTAAP